MAVRLISYTKPSEFEAWDNEELLDKVNNIDLIFLEF